MHVDGSSGQSGDQSFLWFPPVKTNNILNPTLSFTYLTIGSEDGLPTQLATRGPSYPTLQAIVRDAESGSILNSMTISGEQDWYLQENMLPFKQPGVEKTEIVFIATHGPGFDGDVVLKNVSIENIKDECRGIH